MPAQFKKKIVFFLNYFCKVNQKCLWIIKKINFPNFLNKWGEKYFASLRKLVCRNIRGHVSIKKYRYLQFKVCYRKEDVI